MKTCDWVHKLLLDYPQHLCLADQREIQEHLENCVLCRKKAQENEHLSTLLLQIKIKVPTKVRASLLLEFRKRRRKRSKRLLIFSCAAAILLSLVLIFPSKPKTIEKTNIKTVALWQTSSSSYKPGEIQKKVVEVQVPSKTIPSWDFAPHSQIQHSDFEYIPSTKGKFTEEEVEEDESLWQVSTVVYDPKTTPQGGVSIVD